MSATPPKEDTEGSPEVAQDANDTNDARDQQGEPGDGGASAPDSGLYETEVKEQDRWLPIANVARIMKTALPDNAKIAKEAKECMQECVSEFISFITSEAAEKCQHEKRKTVNGEDILFAMTSLGFENYGEALKIYLARYRESQAATGGKHGEPPTPTSATTKPVPLQQVTVATDPTSLYKGQSILDPNTHPVFTTEATNTMLEPTSATGSIGSTGSTGRAHESLLHNTMQPAVSSQDNVLDTKSMNAFEQHGEGVPGVDPGQGQFLQTGDNDLVVERVVDSVDIQ